ncbi:MAG: hypothetical protein QOK44_1271 [Betaproteobacteria bacterium]|nr:hypothetical protein [Betaproteobacteria bacterium]
MTVRENLQKQARRKMLLLVGFFAASRLVLILNEQLLLGDRKMLGGPIFLIFAALLYFTLLRPVRCPRCSRT